MPMPEQTLETNPENGGQDKDVNGNAASVSQETSTDVSISQDEDKSLATLNSMMGRNFNSLEEAKKHYDSLNSFVGDQAIASMREEAKLTQGLVSQLIRENPGWSEADAKKYLVTLQVPEKKAQTPTAQFDSHQADIEERLYQSEQALFAMEHPEAKELLPKISDYAKATGKKLNDAYQYLYADVFRNAQAKAQNEALRLEKKSAQVSASSSTQAPPTENAKYNQLMEQYKKTGNSELFREALKVKLGKK